MKFVILDKYSLLYRMHPQSLLVLCPVVSLYLGRDKLAIFTIDKISSLSCQKVADSITSSKMGNNVAKQASVLLRNIPEYIRRYPSAYCTI